MLHMEIGFPPAQGKQNGNGTVHLALHAQTWQHAEQIALQDMGYIVIYSKPPTLGGSCMARRSNASKASSKRSQAGCPGQCKSRSQIVLAVESAFSSRARLSATKFLRAGEERCWE